mmetsp:Transcript_22058/g.41820  ORF Transcript_22058/g.41820 Transcript_22058/m.41820 type:complete len:208 (-) Transcript_22058:2443-3066(-)
MQHQQQQHQQEREKQRSEATPHMRRSHSSGGSASHRSRAVSVGKVLFTTTLLCFGTLLGYGSYQILRHKEREASDDQFMAITERALVQASESAQRMLLATATAASMVSKLLPDSEQWPLVYIPDFEELTQNMVRLSSPGIKIAFLPLVWPDRVEDFEDFAHRYYYEIRDPPFENGTAGYGVLPHPSKERQQRHVGFGIWDLGGGGAQ